jgi:hypothetical protein
MIAIDEIESGRGFHQINTLQRARYTHWTSHLRSIANLIKIFCPIYEVIVKIIDVGAIYSQRAEPDLVHQVITSFEICIHFTSHERYYADH